MTQLSYKLTRHAANRAAQRSIPIDVIDLILAYGDSRDAGDGARKYALSRRGLREVRKDRATKSPSKLDHFRRAYVIASDEKIITAAFASKPIFH
ncbi:hypothetical protein MB818_05715 [Ruegeria sp. 1NDH52C]|uniref:DUF4258 domain-containing protein n=1 Tax=Ruegeria alba TaxID=2916756 RepID=A0ABS9NTZ0_9RHOB|nr:hypothetical protein [Ruegeria alba]MCG6557686.1 hypothetical protein [Ruegeria alba]